MRLLQGLQTQISVIHALIMRETRTRFGEQKLGYFWALFEPVGVILTFYFAFRFLGQSAPAGLDLVTFIATGLLPFELVMATSERIAESINGNRALLYYPQVHRLDLVFARALLEAATIIVVFVLIIGVNALRTGHFEVHDPLGVLLALTAASLLGTGLGLVFCMAGVVTSVLDRVRGTLLRPLFWISGIFYSAASLPPALRKYAMMNPIFHILELLRSSWTRAYDGHYASPSYVVGCILALLSVGLLLELAVRHKVEVG
jgi:capsular polysaccharide transport system permease protein